MSVRWLCEEVTNFRNEPQLANATLLTVGLILTLREAAQLILERFPVYGVNMKSLPALLSTSLLVRKKRCFLGSVYLLGVVEGLMLKGQVTLLDDLR